jgi:hypothetical protein
MMSARVWTHIGCVAAALGVAGEEVGSEKATDDPISRITTTEERTETDRGENGRTA